MLKDVKWCEYHLYDLFYIYSGNKFDKSKMTAFDPAVNFVGMGLLFSGTGSEYGNL